MATRRAGQVIKKGDRKWLGRVPMARGADGKRKLHSKVVNGSKRDADRYLREQLENRDHGVQPSALTLDEYLDQWLASHAGSIEPRTHHDYTRFLRDYARPVLGKRRLDSLVILDFQGLYDGISRRVSAHATRRTHQALNAAMAQAVRWKLVRTNPITGVKIPKEVKRDYCCLPMEKAKEFQAAADEHPRGLIFSFTLATGMRPSEVLGLRWQDFNPDAGTITVEKSLVVLKDGTFGDGKKWALCDPKTAHSKRTMNIPPTLVRALLDYKREQTKRRLATHGSYQDYDLIFAGPLGLPLERQNLVNRVLRPLKERLELDKRFRWYDLRHSCATLLLAAGENPKVVSERLGHASVAFTLDRYAHVLPGMQESASNPLGSILYGE